MKLYRTAAALLLTAILSIFAFAGCSSASSLPDEMPRDFNFILSYGVNGKNQINTLKGQFTKDMVTNPSVTADLKLSVEEMKSIYNEMKKINILSYPDIYYHKTNTKQTPFYTYSLKVIYNGMEKNIYWEDETVSKSSKSVKLRKLFNNIEEMIINKDEYKKLPDAKGGYD